MSRMEKDEQNEHRVRALEFESIRKKLRASATGHAQQAAKISQGRETEWLSDEEFGRFRGATNAADAEFKQAKRLRKEQRRHEREARKADAAVVSEPAPYGPTSANSWFVDIAIASDRSEASDIFGLDDRFGDLTPAAVEERLQRHSVDVATALVNGNGYGKKVEQVLREQRRQADADVHEKVFREERTRLLEYRTGLTTGGGATASAAGGSGAAFVAPAFILSAWAPFRGIDRTFANQCAPYPLPPYGMQVYVPAFVTTEASSQQIENAGVSETDPTTNLVGAQIQTVASQITLTQQLHDRGFTGGGSFDQIMARELRQRLDGVLDVYVLNQVITGGASVAGNTSWAPTTQGIAPLYQDIAKGREQLTDTAGVRLRPTCFFSTSDFYSYTTRQVDATTFRPWVVPGFAPGFPIAAGADDGMQSDMRRPRWSRFTGTVLPGGVLWFTDDNIPASGSNTQLIVSAPDQAVVLAESDQPILFVYPETFAGNLGAALNLRTYVAAILRHASGTATITGAAYPTSLV